MSENRDGVAGVRKSSKRRGSIRSRVRFRPLAPENLEARLVLTAAPTVLAVSSVSGVYHGTVNLSATLTSGGTPVAGEMVDFVLGTDLGTVVSDTNGVATMTGVSVVGLNAGTFTGSIVASFSGDTNFLNSSGNANLTITPAPLTVAASNVSRVYGQVNPSLVGSVTGIYSGDNVTANFTTTASQYNNVQSGGYPITLASLTGAQSQDYSTTVSGGSATPGTLTITPAPLTVVANAQSKVYGQANPTLTGTVTGILNGDNVAATYSTTAIQFSDVTGPGYAINFAGLGGSKALDYSTTAAGGSYTGATLNITPAPLAVVANNQSKVYGQANPTLTGSVTGILNGDNVTANYATPATQFSNVQAGGYTITLAGLSGSKAPDYSTNVVGGSTTFGTLTVTPAPLTVAATNQSKVYGQVNPTFTGSVTGILNGDNVTANYTTSATQFSDVIGPGYAINFAGLGGSKAPDYSTTAAGGSYTGATLTVTPAPLAITANNQSKVYGQANPTLTGSITGILNGDNVTAIYSTSASQYSGVQAGGYAITLDGLSGPKAPDYSTTNPGSSFTAGALTVTPAPLTVTIDPKTKVYGQANPTLTGSFTGVLNGDDVAPIYATSATQYTDVVAGGSPITATQLTGAKAVDYQITSAPAASLTITPAPVTVTADDEGKVYGQANPNLTGSVSGLLNGDAVTATFGTSATQFSDVTPEGYVVTLSTLAGAKAADYSASVGDGSVITGTLTVTPASLIVAPDSLIKVYGQANPILTGTVTGVLNGDDVAPIYVTSAGQFSDVTAGGYAITSTQLAGAKAADYQLSSTLAAALTVTPAPVSIAVAAKTKVYGQANPTLTGTVLGVLNGDAVTTSYTTSATQFSDVTAGGYSIASTGLSGAKAGDYRVASSVGSTLAVTPAPLTIVAARLTKVYGQPNPALFGTVLGVLNGDDVTASYATTATQYSDVIAHGYAITPTAITGGKAADYSFQVAGSIVIPGALAVSPSPITITAAPKVKVYGQANPTLTGTVTGLLGGDTVTTTFATTATASSPVSASGYAINLVGISGRRSGDYSVATSSPAKLAVTPAPLTVTANAQTRVYGQTNPALTASYGGFVLGQGPTALTGKLSFSTTATTASHVGQNAILLGGLASSNYAIRFVAGNLKITPAPLQVTAVNVIKMYGQAVPTLTASYSGFLNGDTAASLTTPVSLTTAATAATHFGVYPITASGGASGDYTISFVNGAIAVTPAPLVVTPVNVILNAGSALPPLTASYSGFFNGDTAASLTTPVTLSTSATSASAVGVYPITASGGSSADYSIVAAPGFLAITPAPTPVGSAGPIAFVDSLYENMIGRAPESVGLTYWLDHLAAGETDAQVAASIYSSQEAATYRSQHPRTAISASAALAAALRAQAQA